MEVESPAAPPRSNAELEHRSQEPGLPFVLGGRPRWTGWRDAWPGLASLGLVAVMILIPLRGLYRATGASMEEGFMLVFPNLVQEGKVPNVDFLHLYGPTSLDALALWYRVFGDTLESQRTFGLLQILGIIFGVYALGRVAGRAAAVSAAGVATIFILTPIGLSALAWHGALAFGLWAVVFLVRARSTGSIRDVWWAGVFAGLTLGFRPDMVVAVGLSLAFVSWRWTGGERKRVIAVLSGGAAVALLPMWWHLINAGPVAAFEGMVIDPVVHLRPGRELPSPPTWDKVDGALQAVAESLPPWWGLPSPSASQQLFFWFWGVVLASVAGAAIALIAARRSKRTEDAPANLAITAFSLFGLGILPQALQRPDSTHLAWVAVISWSVGTVLLARALRHRLPDWKSGAAAGAAIAVVMLVVCPFFTYRSYLLQTRVSVGDLPLPFEIKRGDHRFWVGDPAVHAAITEMTPDLEARMEPDDRLFVGPGDLRHTIYADTYIYWLFPELEPATYYIEMDPGLADAEGSGMAADIESADFVVLTNTWSGLDEPNASQIPGSPEHNQAVADNFCLVGSYQVNLVLLFERCEGGGGLNPADVAGRTEGIGGTGLEDGTDAPLHSRN